MNDATEQRDSVIAQLRSNPAVKRVEVIGGQTLILGDCLEVMPVLGRFDLVATDPPYGATMTYQPSSIASEVIAAGRIKLHDQVPGSRWLEQVTA